MRPKRDVRRRQKGIRIKHRNAHAESCRQNVLMLGIRGSSRDPSKSSKLGTISDSRILQFR